VDAVRALAWLPSPLPGSVRLWACSCGPAAWSWSGEGRALNGTAGGTRLVDDLDGKELPEGSGETVRFGLDDVSYEIDLSRRHADRFRSGLAPFVAAGRTTSAISTASRASRASTASAGVGRGAGPGRRRMARTGGGRSSREELANIRRWAVANGYKVSPRGRLARAVRDAHHAAHA
jgi:hypothetical protein